MFWQNNLLSKLGENVLLNIDNCQYQIDNQWYYADISKNGIMNEKYQITVTIPENISGIITGIRLLGYGTIIGEKPEYIIKGNNKAMLLKIRFNIYEGDDEQ